jgi:hypothetical protein
MSQKSSLPQSLQSVQLVLTGNMRRRRWAEQEEFQQSAYLQQQQNTLSQGRSNYNQAFGVCMTGRGYTVG